MFFAGWLAGCTGQKPLATPLPMVSAPAQPSPVAAAEARAPDPDLNRPRPVPRLAIDWAQIALASDGDAAALWQQIAPTTADWDDKLAEVPPPIANRLAIALLREGNFTCAQPPTGDCAKPLYDVPPPGDAAGLGDPCLRRLLAMWAIERLDDDDLAQVKPALLAIARIPPPESQLIAAALRAVPEADHATRLELLAAAWQAGQHDLVDASVGTLDPAHLEIAASRHHIAGALEVLSPEASRAVYLAAITDARLPARARIMAITELGALAALSTSATQLAPDLQAALAGAAAAADCSVAAAAIRVLAQHGDRRLVPRRPRTANKAQLMRSLCVLASYEALQASDEPSLLASYLPARGLERVTFTHDPLSDVDSDSDGDPHTNRSDELVPRDEAVLPELEDMIRAMQHCTGAVCVSDEREFRFVWRPAAGGMVLTRIELADRPPCAARHATRS